jgi:AcrR family transcriptional regulator
MSRGAIYGNFRNREELLFAVVATLWQPVTPQLRPGATIRELLEGIGRAVAEAAQERRPMAVGAASFQEYALSHPRMAKVVAEENTKIYARLAQHLTTLIPQDQLPMPAETFVRVTHALSDGLMFAHFMSPEEFTEDVIIAAFRALAGPADQLRVRRTSAPAGCEPERAYKRRISGLFAAAGESARSSRRYGAGPGRLDDFYAVY